MPRNSSNNSLIKFNEIKGIFDNYLFLKRKSYSILPFSKDKKSKEAIESIKKLEGILNRLKYPYSLILRKTFIEQNDLYWWSSFFTTTKYYRLRNLAIDSFLLAYETLDV